LELNKSDILQANVTIIAGLLVLLTISSFVSMGSSQNNSPDNKIIDIISNPRIWVAYIILPFIASILNLLREPTGNDEEKKKKSEDNFKKARLSFKVGLFLLLGYLLVLYTLSGFTSFK